MSKLSEQDVSLVLELVETLPLKEVADKFEVYPETIRYHMEKNKVAFKGNVPALRIKNANVLEQLKTKTVTVIAREIGVSVGAIYYQLEKQNIKKSDIRDIQRNNQHLLLIAIKEKVDSGINASESIKAHGITLKKYERLTANQLRVSA